MVAFTRAILTVTFLLATYATSVYSKPISYTKADLEILKQGKNYVEFFKHAKDIVPTERDQSWLNMVSSMASELADVYRQQEKYQDEHYNLIEKLSSWPELSNDEFFQIKRNSFALIYFKRCLLRPQKSDCYNKMTAFWKTARQDPETGYQLLVLAEGFFPHKNSWRFIEKAVKSKFSQFYCPKELVQHTVEKRLRRFSALDFQSEQFRDQLMILANKECWRPVSQYLKEKLLEDSAKGQAVLFYTLKALDFKKDSTLAAYLIKYYLEGPSPGPLMNLAWSKLEALSQNFPERDQALTVLMSLDPLPGAIFTQDKKHQVLTRHLVSNFPEYINYYTKVCVKYLSGSQVFPYGNPTVNCPYLFKINEKKVLGEKVISQPLRIRYSGLVKGTDL